MDLKLLCDQIEAIMASLRVITKMVSEELKTRPAPRTESEGPKSDDHHSLPGPHNREQGARMKIITTGRYGRNVSDRLIAENLSEIEASDTARRLNSKSRDDDSYFRVVPDDYKLYVWEPWYHEADR